MYNYLFLKFFSESQAYLPKKSKLNRFSHLITSADLCYNNYAVKERRVSQITNFVMTMHCPTIYCISLQCNTIKIQILSFKLL